VSKTIAVVGGIPNPIGGVTTFVRRVISRERAVRWVFDLYPSGKKQLPNEYDGKYYCSKSKFLTVARLWFFCLAGRCDIVHFNFSTPRSLILLMFLPKRRMKWALTLHHGDLGLKVKTWAKWVLSTRVDYALALNERQREWYLRSIPSGRITISSPYVRPSTPHPTLDFYKEIHRLKSKHSKIFVCSGYPTKIYNHSIAIDLMKNRPRDLLVCCLYGVGGQMGAIRKQASENGNVIIFDLLDEENFNFLLAESDVYLRLNSEDSFGIAVADSLNLGSKCISTDVCPRYQGSVLIPIPKNSEEIECAINDLFSNGLEFRVSTVKIIDFTYSNLSE